MARARLADSLVTMTINTFFFVRYPRSYSVHNEWVFNGANVASQRVVWARDLGQAQDVLLAHFPNVDADLVSVSDSTPFYELRPFR